MDAVEYFGEVFVPWLANDRLDMNLAARHADYFGSGGIWAYKIGLSTQLTDSLRLRGTRSHDVRAGTLADRYDQTGAAGSVNDPFNGGVSVNIFEAGGGDPNIRPEEADTISLGAVYQPNWAEGLSLSVDWYEVSLSDAIDSLTSQQVVDQCFAGDQELCARIFRLPNGSINLVQATVRNVAEAFVSGVDIEVGYSRSVDWFGGGEVVGVRLISSHLSENSTQSFASPKIDRAGQLYLFDFPKDKYVASVNYQNGSFGAFLQARYVDGGYRDVLAVEGVDIDDNTISSVTYVDLNLRYELEVGDGTWEIYGSAQNLTDEAPPVVANFGFFGASSSQTNSGLHDLLGRRYTVGAQFSF
jgi:outer membrane cobalamin receptor